MAQNPVFDWVTEMCKLAMTEARSGNTGLLHRLAATPALQHFFNNVYALQTLDVETWKRDYPGWTAQLESMYAEYQAQTSTVQRVQTLEAQLAEQGEVIKSLQARLTEGTVTPPTETPTETEGGVPPTVPEKTTPETEPGDEGDEEADQDTTPGGDPEAET